MKGGSLPIVVTREEALQHAAQLLREMAKGDGIAAFLAALGSELPVDSPNARESVNDLKAKVPEPRLQEKACIAAAETIDALLLEERIVAARVAAAACKSGSPA